VTDRAIEVAARELSDGLVARAVELAAADGEFMLTLSGWSGAIELRSDARSWLVTVRDERPVVVDGADGPACPATVIGGDAAAWSELLAELPRPGASDFFAAARAGTMTIEPVIVLPGLHAAVRRLCDLLRCAANGLDPTPHAVEPNVRRHGEIEPVLGRYVHLDLLGTDYRVYFEEAGSGIPLLCQHTAAGDARQWRHLLADESVTSRFRVIAYDLPWHGRSLPAQSRAWWAEEYKLTRDFAMAVPVGLAEVLGLDQPIFVGASIGGMLALDLARYHPDLFRAVISLQGGLRASGGLTPEGEARMRQYSKTERLIDPALQGERNMSMTAPTAPEAYRHETVLGYAQSAPGVYAGDLYYHALDHDLREEAASIDTSRCAVRLLTGNYDFTMVPISERAAREIPGATLEIMEGLGHFPMSEDHAALMRYLGPVLTELTEP
jgi:pimeloyl-ACP methyl ester carboxylesterase